MSTTTPHPQPPPPPPPRLHSKVCLVTGSSSGLGRAIALAFAHNGAHLIVCADLRPEPRPGIDGEVAPTHEEICRVWGEGRAVFVKCDVGVSEEVRRAVEVAVAEGGRLDVMVNNAGLGTEDRTIRLHELDDAEWERVMHINSTGVYHGCKHALAQMLRQPPPSPSSSTTTTTPPSTDPTTAATISGTPASSAPNHTKPRQPDRGNIVNISSMLGKAGISGGAGAYCASKGAVLNLTRQLAVDYARDRIHVNALCPGFTKTAMTLTNFSDNSISESMTSTTPWGEWGRVEDVAMGAVFLASSDAAFVTGVGLDVDGGYLAQ